MEGLHAERQVKFVKSAGIVASSWLRSWAKQSGTHDIFRKDSSTIGHQLSGSPRDVRAKPATIGSLVAARMSNTLN